MTEPAKRKYNRYSPSLKALVLQECETRGKDGLNTKEMAEKHSVKLCTLHLWLRLQQKGRAEAKRSAEWRYATPKDSSAAEAAIMRELAVLRERVKGLEYALSVIKKGG